MVVCFIEFISYRLAEAGLARRKIILLTFAFEQLQIRLLREKWLKMVSNSSLKSEIKT